VSEVGGQVQVRGYLDVLRRYRSFWWEREKTGIR
jgi:hypothetical protein